MGLLSKLSAWIADLSGGTEAAETTETDDGETAGASEDSDTDEGSTNGTAATLDPGATTETRTAPTDDAVDALRDVRRSQELQSTEGDVDETGSVENVRSDGSSNDSDETIDQASSKNDR